MNILITLVLSALPFLASGGQETKPTESNHSVENPSEMTTFYLIRHAEKDASEPGNRDPELSEEGHLRAQQWSNYFEEISLDAVYSTNYKRTLATAKPTADSKGLEVKLYEPQGLFEDSFLEAAKGRTVLVVGHSNTTPVFANALLKENRFPDMDEKEFGTLYLVTINGEGKVTCEVVQQ